MYKHKATNKNTSPVPKRGPHHQRYKQLTAVAYQRLSQRWSQTTFTWRPLFWRGNRRLSPSTTPSHVPALNISHRFTFTLVYTSILQEEPVLLHQRKYVLFHQECQITTVLVSALNICHLTEDKTHDIMSSATLEPDLAAVRTQRLATKTSTTLWLICSASIASMSFSFHVCAASFCSLHLASSRVGGANGN